MTHSLKTLNTCLQWHTSSERPHVLKLPQTGPLIGTRFPSILPYRRRKSSHLNLYNVLRMCAWKAFSPHLQFVVHYGWVTAKLGKLFLAAVSPRARESSKQQSLDKNYSIPGSCAPQRSIIGTTVVLLSLFSVSLVVIACVWNRDSRGRNMHTTQEKPCMAQPFNQTRDSCLIPGSYGQHSTAFCTVTPALAYIVTPSSQPCQCYCVGTQKGQHAV